MTCLCSDPLGLSCWVSYAPVFGYMFCWALFFVLSFFCFDWYMYVLRDGALMGWGLLCEPDVCVSWSASRLGLVPLGMFGPSDGFF